MYYIQVHNIIIREIVWWIWVPHLHCLQFLCCFCIIVLVSMSAIGIRSVNGVSFMCHQSSYYGTPSPIKSHNDFLTNNILTSTIVMILWDILVWTYSIQKKRIGYGIKPDIYWDTLLSWRIVWLWHHFINLGHMSQRLYRLKMDLKWETNVMRKYTVCTNEMKWLVF